MQCSNHPIVCLTYELGAAPVEGQEAVVVQTPHPVTASRLHPIHQLQLPHQLQVSATDEPSPSHANTSYTLSSDLGFVRQETSAGSSCFEV